MRLTKSLEEEIKNLFLEEWDQYVIDNDYDDPEYDYTEEDKIVALESFAEEWIESHEDYLDAIIENADSLDEVEFETDHLDYTKYQEAEVILLDYLEEIVDDWKNNNNNLKSENKQLNETKKDEEYICPICNSEIEYDYDEKDVESDMYNKYIYYKWKCDKCGSIGEVEYLISNEDDNPELWDEDQMKFNRHLNIEKKSNLIESLNNLNESYYSIWARNNGMWGGMLSTMKTHGKQIVFTNKEEAQKYLDSIRDKQGYINNFNSYGLEEIKEDVEEDKYTILVDTVEELIEKEKQLDIDEKSQKETAKQNILHLAEVASSIIEGKKLNKADIETKNMDNYGEPELTVFLRDDNYNSIYINIKIQKDDKIQIYCEYKEYVNTIQEAEERLKDLINSYLSEIKIKKESKNMNLRERLEEEYGAILSVLQINPDEEDTIGDLLYLDVSGKEIEKIKEVAPLNYAQGIGHNGAPDNDTFLKFLLENPQFEAECYLTTPNRSDYRFEIVGVKADYNDKNIEILDNFLKNLPGQYEEPDEYGEYQKKIRAWWD